MAQITYADKTALYQNQDIAAENKVRDVDMNEIKEVVNDNETKILLDVTDTAPAECSTGDMYFNTTDNLIYTATATDTWGSTGVAPTENTIYVVISTQTSYVYNGITLVSVGSSSGSVVNNYSTSTTEGYSCNYINNTIVNAYSTSQNNAYSCDYINDLVEHVYSATTLYNGPSTNTNVTLSDSAVNYSQIEIFFHSVLGYRQSVKVIQNNIVIDLSTAYYESNANVFYVVGVKGTLQGTNLTLSDFFVATNGAISDTVNKYIYIDKVVGYKEV